MLIEAIKVILKMSNINLLQQVESAYNGKQAVDAVKRRGPHNMFDIIFMDINMPYKDGPEASREIREYIDSMLENRSETMGMTWKQPKIVAVTGHTEDVYVQRARSCGID